MIRSFINIDTLIAIGLIVLLIGAFLTSRIRALPKKSLPFIIAALAGVVGIALFRNRRALSRRQDLKRREEEIRALEKKLQGLKKRYGVSEEKRQELKAELEQQRTAYEQTILQIRAENKKEKERIDGLAGEELHQEFRDALGNP